MKTKIASLMVTIVLCLSVATTIAAGPTSVVGIFAGMDRFPDGTYFKITKPGDASMEQSFAIDDKSKIKFDVNNNYDKFIGKKIKVTWVMKKRPGFGVAEEVLTKAELVK